MIALAYYLLKVIVCSGIFFLYYHFALRNKLFHQWNRFYLLAVVLISTAIPLLQFTFIHHEKEPSRAIQILQTVQSADLYMEETYLRSHPFLSTEQWMGIGYAAVSLIFLTTVILSISRIYSIIRRHKVQLVHDIKFLSTKEKGTPFSFLRYIFWNDNIDVHSPTGQQIFQHELVHVKEAHTFDKLFIQITLVAFWSNPIFWLIRKELQLIHEFIADKKAIQQHDTAALASMILQTAYPHQFSSITNQFFQSPIKRRLLMLSKIQNPRINYFSRILALPLVAITILAFTFRTKEGNPIIPLDKEITVVIDAGHGKMPNGQMNGARAENVYEDDIVLALARKIRDLNSNDKIHIVMTRTSEDIVDLHKRVDIAKEQNADLFISLHTGALPEGYEGSGIQVFVSNKNTRFQKQSELLGSALKDELTAIYQTSPDLLKHNSGVWVLDKNVCPSVLVECGFITDKKDREFITNAASQRVIAERILKAIERYATSSQLSRATNAPFMQADKEIHSINTNSYAGRVTVVYADNTSETITTEEAEQRNLINKTSPKNIISPLPKKDTSQQWQTPHQEGKPIYYVDGTEFKGDINKLDPAKIASINILKGQTAVSKYGEKGKNGVVEIVTKPGNKTNIFDTVPKNTPVFEKAEVEASIDAVDWRQFLEKNLQPILEEVSKKAPSGKYTIAIRFLVGLDGSVSDIKALKDPGYGMAEKIVDMMKKSPKWKPAIQNNRPVRSYHTQPIMLVIANEKDPSKT
jgi:N-acetylmuramoyl-L-alanine amidase